MYFPQDQPFLDLPFKVVARILKPMMDRLSDQPRTAVIATKATQKYKRPKISLLECSVALSLSVLILLLLVIMLKRVFTAIALTIFDGC